MPAYIQASELPNTARVTLSKRSDIKWAKDVFNVPMTAKYVILCGHNEDSPSDIYYCETTNKPTLSDFFIRHPHYIVLCGNIGTVYDGYDELQARRDYMNYAETSKMGIGRAGNEEVTIMCNDEVMSTHMPAETRKPVTYDAIRETLGELAPNLTWNEYENIAEKLFVMFTKGENK